MIEMNPVTRFRIQDILLTLIFGTLIFLAHDISERLLLLALAVLQLLRAAFVVSPLWLPSARS